MITRFKQIFSFIANFNLSWYFVVNKNSNEVNMRKFFFNNELNFTINMQMQYRKYCEPIMFKANYELWGKITNYLYIYIHIHLLINELQYCQCTLFY